MRSILRSLVVTSIVAATLVVGVTPARAVRLPRTLAQRLPVTAAPVEPGFPIDYLGVLWDGEGHGADGADGADGAMIRFRADGRWGPWIPLREDGAEEEGEFASGLVAGGDADAYQVRVPPAVTAPEAVAINTTDGPAVTVNHRPTDSAGAGTDHASDFVTRVEWGADERLRFDSQGNETWPPDYWPVQKLTVHHTATRNDDIDPAATVRAIYRYHAVDRGWGDIGYQYLIDETGRVYEGRWSGTDDDPGHGVAGLGVTGAHVGGYNSGNLGVALLGTLTSRPPTAAARLSLEQLLADLTSRHDLDPEGGGLYLNPVNGATKNVANVAGHRDWAPTECPGGALYDQLPTVRRHVASLNAPGDSTTTTVATSTTSTTATRTKKPPRSPKK